MYRTKPSHAHRWLKCSTSIRLGEEAGGEAQGSSAGTGLLAHKIAEKYISSCVLGDAEEFDYNPYTKDERYEDDMPGNIAKYTEYVGNQVQELRDLNIHFQANVEVKVELDPYLPGQVGYIDFALIHGTTAKIHDLKYGRGDVADAQENPQLRIYGLGLLTSFPTLRHIEFYIHQPLLNKVTKGVMIGDDLKQWGWNHLIPRANIARSGGANTVPGSWCKYCPAAPTCAARIDKAVDEYRAAFPTLKPELVGLEELAQTVKQVEVFESWIKDARKYIQKQLLEGQTTSVYKLVKGRSSRRFTDPEEVKRVMRKLGYKRSEYVNSKVGGLTQMTNLLGVDGLQEHLGHLIEKPEGPPVLADINDKRDAYEAERTLIAYDIFSDYTD
jgi:hypothetical protein